MRRILLWIDKRSIARWIGRAGSCGLLLLSLPVYSAQMDIHGPLGSIAFGTSVTVLPNGNVVVTDPDGPVSNVGAVYLYNASGTLISTLLGSDFNDHVGQDGVVVVGSSNFVVKSSSWHAQIGAVTWVNGTTGTGPGITVVSASNSLVGTIAYDSVGSGGVIALSNGNYVVASPSWNNGVASSVFGAVTWGNGNAGIVGAVSTSNSLFGTKTLDEVGGGNAGFNGMAALKSGNYVVSSPNWNNGVASAHYGAVTWGNGNGGTIGAVSTSNSLFGTTVNDRVGDNDIVGGNGVTALTNGNYVVVSALWNGTAVKTGAATWGNGNGGTFGAVSASNSLVGTKANDQVGTGLLYNRVTALSNGNYVVGSVNWSNGAKSLAGAATWGNGGGGTVGPLSIGNSLIGTTAGDGVGKYITALSNGNYVVASPFWHNGAGVGAVTWGNGSGGVMGAVSAGNSLVGTSSGDNVGNGGVHALSNGNYVVASYDWNGVGAATWANGSSSTTDTISFGNSLIGSNTGDHVGEAVAALSNGNFVVASPGWQNSGTTNAGAATWSGGSSGSIMIGFLSTGSSLVGTTTGDYVGGVIAVGNGNYVVKSESWNNGVASSSYGAVTWCNGSGGSAGAVTASNSLIGTTINDSVGLGGVAAQSDGNYVISSPWWNNGATTQVGAITLASSRFRLKGTIQPWNSVLGMSMNHGGNMTYDYDSVRHQLVVGRPKENIVSLFTMDQIFAGDFDP